MQCKSCGYPNSHVVDTKRNERTNQIIRRRECIKCGVRYNTQEQVKEAEPNFKTSPPRSILEK